MADIVTICGSPSANSRSHFLLDYAKTYLEPQGFTCDAVSVLDVPPEDLIRANFSSPHLLNIHQLVDSARAVIVATPVYKATYTGALKTLLDLLPQYGFANKLMLPIATGGTLAHLLAIDCGMKPLFSVMGATHILRGVYVEDAQMPRKETGELTIDTTIEERLKVALDELAAVLQLRSPSQGTATT
ncbi:MAG: NADPH-dependent FMN reductase [Coleofasciculaceae cyanobacterium SM2_3_26]|nr:NADPH-dependent FMN reductase [Coleofasciculaceae cyanobacterium SM2_3_26]